MCCALDWLAFDDLLEQAAHHGQSFQLLRYLPFLPAAFHVLFASSHVPRITFPSSQQEVPPLPGGCSGSGPRGLCSPGPGGSFSVLGPDPDEPDEEPHTDTGVRYDTGHPEPGHTTGPRSRYSVPAPGCPRPQAAPRECQTWGRGWGLWPRWLRALLRCPTRACLTLGEHAAVQRP